MCCTTAMGTGKSFESWPSTEASARGPPVEAPRPTSSGGCGERGRASVEKGEAGEAGAVAPSTSRRRRCGEGLAAVGGAGEHGGLGDELQGAAGDGLVVHVAAVRGAALGDDHDGRGPLLHVQLDGLEAADAGHGEIHGDEIGQEPRRQLQRLLAGGGRADHLQQGVGLDGARESVAAQRGVVDHQHPKTPLHEVDSGLSGAPACNGCGPLRSAGRRAETRPPRRLALQAGGAGRARKFRRARPPLSSTA